MTEDNDSLVFQLNDKQLVEHFLNNANRHISDAVNPEMMRRLKIAIEKFNEQSSKQTRWLIWLTIAMLIAVATQIGLAIYSFIRF